MHHGGSQKAPREDFYFGLKPGVGCRSSSAACGCADVACLLQPIAVAVHLEDVDVVGQPVGVAHGQPLGPEHAGHSSNGRLLVTMVERARRLVKTSNSSSAPVVDSGTYRVHR